MANTGVRCHVPYLSIGFRRQGINGLRLAEYTIGWRAMRPAGTEEDHASHEPIEKASAPRGAEAGSERNSRSPPKVRHGSAHLPSMQSQMGFRGPQRGQALGIPPRRSTLRPDAPKPGVFRGPRHGARDEFPHPVYEAGFCFKDSVMTVASCFPSSVVT